MGASHHTDDNWLGTRRIIDICMSVSTTVFCVHQVKLRSKVRLEAAHIVQKCKPTGIAADLTQPESKDKGLTANCADTKLSSCRYR